MDIYLVGGAVRDAMLGRPVSERDWVVVGGTDAEMRAHGFAPKDSEFAVYLHPDTGDEYVLARRERKVEPGHRGFAVDFAPDVSLDEDLARRDLTVNAMARDANGALSDPFAGAIDLERRVLRHVTEAFVEDPLRVLRLARFHAELSSFGFEIDSQTSLLAQSVCAGEDLVSLSGTRIWRETSRALLSDDPMRFFQPLAEWGALEQLMPELIGNDAVRCGVMPLFNPAVELGADRLTARLALMFCERQRTASAIEIRARATRLAERFELQRSTREILVAACHPLPHDINDAEQVLTWMEAADAIRRTERWRLIVALQVARGGLSKRRASLLSDAAIMLGGVRAAAPITGESMRRARLEALGRCLASSPRP